jgi:hypothetical protein
VSWDWTGLLAVGAIGAALCAGLAAAVQRQTAELKLARAQLQDLRPRVRRAGQDVAPQRPGLPRSH